MCIVITATKCRRSHMNVSGGLWSVLGLASSHSLGVGLVLSAALLMGHMGSWLPHTRLGLQDRDHSSR